MTHVMEGLVLGECCEHFNQVSSDCKKLGKKCEYRRFRDEMSLSRSASARAVILFLHDGRISMTAQTIYRMIHYTRMVRQNNAGLSNKKQEVLIRYTTSKTTPGAVTSRVITMRGENGDNRGSKKQDHGA